MGNTPSKPGKKGSDKGNGSATNASGSQTDNDSQPSNSIDLPVPSGKSLRGSIRSKIGKDKDKDSPSTSVQNITAGSFDKSDSSRASRPSRDVNRTSQYST